MSGLTFSPLRRLKAGISTAVSLCLWLGACSPAQAPPTEPPSPTNTSISPSATPVPPTATSSPEPTDTLIPSPTSTDVPTAAPPTQAPASLDDSWLISEEDVLAFPDDLGIIDWEVDEEIPGSSRICRVFAGTSWSTSQNFLMNCIHTVVPGTSFSEVIASMYEIGVLYSTDIDLEPLQEYDHPFDLYAYMSDNGHSVYNAFLLSDGLLFRVSLSLGTPGGDTPESLFASQGEAIEAYLVHIIELNMQKSSEPAEAVADPEPETACRISSATAIAGASAPAYDVILENFAPGEVVTVMLTATENGTMGTFLGTLTNASGQLDGSVVWTNSSEAPPANITLTVSNAACTASLNLTWP